MHGCNGKMGQVITGLCKEDPAVEIVAGIDVVDNKENGYPVFTDIDSCDVAADVTTQLQSRYRLFFVRRDSRRSSLIKCLFAQKR